MLIALDYDDTYTLDKGFWDKFILSCVTDGHSVIVVTARTEDAWPEDIYNDLQDKVEDIIFTGHRAKQLYCEEIGYYPSVWIDDFPTAIVKDMEKYGEEL